MGCLALISYSIMRFGSKHQQSKPKLLMLGYSPFAAYLILLIPSIIFTIYLTKSYLENKVIISLIIKGWVYSTLFVLLTISIGIAGYYFNNFLRNKNWVKA